MAILNYTTKLTVDQTTAYIQKTLRRANAQAVMCEYDSNKITHISFRINTPHGLITFRLPADAEGVLKAMQKAGLPKSYCTEEHAQKVAWRIVKDWLEAQLAIIEAGMATMAEVFLPYAQTSTGETVYQKLLNQGFPALTQQH